MTKTQWMETIMCAITNGCTIRLWNDVIYRVTHIHMLVFEAGETDNALRDTILLYYYGMPVYCICFC